jgi:DNA-binding response OmpR family regulator
VGKIEEAILENYKQSLQEGNLVQAKVSVNLAKTLKDLIEKDGFIDFESGHSSFKGTIHGDFFQPFPYRYYPNEGVVVVAKTAINLTNTENRLFYLLSQNETHGDIVKVVSREQIRAFLWNERRVTRNAIRILVKRLRTKIEPSPNLPQIILSYNKKGYIFVGKRVNESEQQ